MYRYFMFAALLLMALQAEAQKTREELETERVANEKKIAETNRILEQTQKYRVETVSKLNALTQQIRQREHYIGVISEELTFIDKEIVRTEEKIAAMEKELKELKEEYATMVYMAAKTNNSMEKLSFLFSSRSFNQLMSRIQYFEQYKEARQKQMAQIEKTRAALQARKQEIERDRSDKQQLLNTQKEQFKSLSELKDEQTVVIASLKVRESELKGEIAKRKLVAKRLDDMILLTVKKITENDKKNSDAPVKNQPGMKPTPDAGEMTGSFLQNKNKMIWPVKEGFITGKFGTHPHPVFPKIMVENLGIDIRTNINEPVRAIFAGKVSAVTRVPGSGMVVVIQHGEYFTVYARLQSVNVKPNDKVKAKQLIGVVETNPEGAAEVQLQVWKGSEKLDPESWLKLEQSAQDKQE